MQISKQEVKLRYHYGSDLEVVNAARVSFNKKSEWEEYDHDEEYDVETRSITYTNKIRLSEKDAKLISYLAKHNHWTPFAHVGATLHLKTPLFVARQLGKHQTGLVWNEVSRRYVDSEPEFYIPDAWRGRAVNAKQGSGGVIEDELLLRDLNFNVKWFSETALKLYKNLLNDGVAPEQARMVLPQNTMTEWIWTGSLAAWARVYNLRSDLHVQIETQEVAKMICVIMKDLFPVSWSQLTSPRCTTVTTG